VIFRNKKALSRLFPGRMPALVSLATGTSAEVPLFKTGLMRGHAVKQADMFSISRDERSRRRKPLYRCQVEGDRILAGNGLSFPHIPLRNAGEFASAHCLGIDES